MSGWTTPPPPNPKPTFIGRRRRFPLSNRRPFERGDLVRIERTGAWREGRVVIPSTSGWSLESKWKLPPKVKVLWLCSGDGRMTVECLDPQAEWVHENKLRYADIITELGRLL